ncbi:MAG: SLC13 family permease, partial [Bacteroidota bacterium]
LLSFAYLILVVPKLLPDRGLDNSSRNGKYFLEASISPDSRLIGRSVTANGLRNLDSLYLAEIVRGDRLISPVMPEEILQPNDGLIFTGDVSQISELRKFDGLRILDHIDAIARSTLQEVVIKHDAPVIGRRVKDLNFRTRFDAVVVGVRRGENKLPGKIGPMILQPGDNLILAVGKEFEKHDNLRQNFIFIQPIESDEYLNYRESWLALGIFLSGLGLTALGITSLFKAMLGALLIYLILGYLPRKSIRKNINLGLLIMIGSSLAIARVLQNYGLAQTLAQGIIHVFGDHAAWGALTGIYLATLVLTELVTNNAAAAIIFPIALSTAQQLEVSPMPFVMVVAYAASASFLTPIGYQTNTMVYSLGQYQFKDFFRSGLGLTLLYAVLVISLVPRFFPF